MGLSTIQVAGADSTATNDTGTSWVATKQLTTGKSKLFNFTVNVPSGIAADRFIVFYDSATAVTASPVCFFRAFYGVTLVQQLDGKLFTNGIYYRITKTEPAAYNTSLTNADADDALVSTDYRVL
jgi:3-mercaptopyruvate sulfurtransferase SseA